MPNELRVKFWGVRGSYPTPGAGTIKYGGNTASVEIRAGERTIVLDAGTGIISLGRELARTKRTCEILLLLSHLHHDHTQGFPFFLPAYLPNVKLHIYGPDGTHKSMKNVLERNQSFETFPVGLCDMASSKDIQSVRESQVIVWDEVGVRVAESDVNLSDEAVLIRMHKSYAHPGGVYAYRITWRGKSVVYATDTEGYVGTDRKLVHFARNADLLIHDAQYLEEHYHGQLAGFPSTQGFGHSTITMACDVAMAAEVERLVLFHHDPSYDDAIIANNEGIARARFHTAIAAYEGLEFVLQDKNRKQVLVDVSRGRAVQYAENE
ncbi:MAG: MBL fold metallo-hydrolase [Anaerolineae bacterium]|nr:MBL fold metallo-hydrolase [Anaerolineae bacterium]